MKTLDMFLSPVLQLSVLVVSELKINYCKYLNIVVIKS